MKQKGTKGALDTVAESSYEKIFVYGTLKKGKQFNYLLKKAKFLGNAETVEKFALYFDQIPYMIKDEKISTIKGEVYEVTPEILKEVDIFEEHPTYYHREQIKVKLDSGKIIDAWAYLFPTKKGFLIEKGEY